MTTKEQERKALEKIITIINELGEDSYVATAFEGCIQDARDNINNDWAMSMADRYESAKKEIKSMQEDIDELKAECTLQSDRADKAESWKRLATEKDNEVITWVNNCNAALAKQVELEKRIAEQEQEIIVLKAKLYDMMTK